MTTIAYDGNGKIATDGRCCRGSTIINDNFVKQKIVNDVQFYFSGSTADIDAIVNSYFGAELTLKTEINALVIDGGNLFLIGPDDENKTVWACSQDLNEPNTIGSGADHALTAMDVGCTAKEAIEFAIKRDSGSGGTIRVYDIKTGEEVEG